MKRTRLAIIICTVVVTILAISMASARIVIPKPFPCDPKVDEGSVKVSYGTDCWAQFDYCIDLEGPDRCLYVK